MGHCELILLVLVFDVIGAGAPTALKQAARFFQPQVFEAPEAEKMRACKKRNECRAFGKSYAEGRAIQVFSLLLLLALPQPQTVLALVASPLTRWCVHGFS
jgi:hypothetical protein